MFLDLQSQTVLVIGGGKVAERKIRLLRKTGAHVQVVAKVLNQKVDNWRLGGCIDWVAQSYQAVQLDGVRLVFAASNDVKLNLRVFRDAEARRIAVNVVDNQRYCRFITPAIVDRAPLQIAISSGGASPVLARRIRGWIERLLPLGIGKIAESAGKFRSLASARMTIEPRRRFWDALLSRGNILRWSNYSSTVIDGNIRRALAKPENSMPRGKVYLVGAGPGRGDLLTIRALQVMGQADFILYDKLVSPEILDMARRDADFVNVGKRAGKPQHSQHQINRMLTRYARQGKNVVRLKGGDAFIFGRGGEELEYLKTHGVDYEVVPGITAALGCAAFAGIPLTHREYAQTLSFVTGRLANDTCSPDWQQLAGTGRTAVVYMGVKQASQLREQLLEAGFDKRFPVALIANGTRSDQQVFHGNINELPALAAKLSQNAPGLIIIGEVAALGKKLAWFESGTAIRKAA